jgi:carboxymethylenebutenolidase
MIIYQPNGFLAVPTSSNGRSVLVLHAWWGLTETIKDFCTRLAGEGFTAFAPDLYHGKIATTIPEAEALRDALNWKKSILEISTAAKFLQERSREPEKGLAVIGFSLGAFFALNLSITDPERINKVVVFYGTGQVDFTKSRASYQGHFAENDPFEPESEVAGLEESLKAAGHPTTFYRYVGTGHWFFELDRVDAYNLEAADLAWERTLSFLQGKPLV